MLQGPLKCIILKPKEFVIDSLQDVNSYENKTIEPINVENWFKFDTPPQKN